MDAIIDTDNKEAERTFECDKCLTIIKCPEKGLLEFSNQDEKFSDFRIVHESKKCSPGNSSGPLENYLGPDGMARMLAMLANEGVADVRGWVRVFYRLHIPYFEECRNSLDSSMHYRQEDMIAILNEQFDVKVAE